MAKSLNTEHQLSISEFKAKCLRLLDETEKKGRRYTITRKGKPIARVVPLRKTEGFIRGSLKGLAVIHGDIVHFDTSDDWNVLKE